MVVYEMLSIGRWANATGTKRYLKGQSRESDARVAAVRTRDAA